MTSSEWKKIRFCVDSGAGEIVSAENGDALYSGMSGECRPGYYCDGGNTRSNGQKSGIPESPCSKGTSCEKMSSAESECTAGFYQNEMKGDKCYDCTPGTSCESTKTEIPKTI